MLVWSLMENTPPNRIARLKEKLVSWRPVATELSEDYGEMYADLKQWLRQAPWHFGPLVWAFLFILGLGVGASLKSVAHSAVMIGHEDYRLIPADRLYDLNQLREQALENGAMLPVQEKKTYPACDQSSMSGAE